MIIAIIALGGCDRQSTEKAQPDAATQDSESGKGLTGKIDRSAKGSRIPDMTFTDPKGRTLRLTSLKGKPVLINLWATWCAPCVTEMPMLDKLASDLDGKIRVVTVSQDMQGAAKVSPFFAKSGFRHLEPWLDSENSLAFQYGNVTLPMTILYDSEGREVWRMLGGFDWSTPQARSMVGEAS